MFEIFGCAGNHGKKFIELCKTCFSGILHCGCRTTFYWKEVLESNLKISPIRLIKAGRGKLDIVNHGQLEKECFETRHYWDVDFPRARC